MTHTSRTDPEARLYRKSRGQAATLSHLGHTLGENRHGLIVNVTVTEATPYPGGTRVSVCHTVRP